MAVELSVLSTQCLDRSIPDTAMLTEEVAAWDAERNKKHAKADWQFTAADARMELKEIVSVNMSDSEHCIRSDHHAQDRRMTNTCRPADRSRY